MFSLGPTDLFKFWASPDFDDFLSNPKLFDQLDRMAVIHIQGRQNYGIILEKNFYGRIFYGFSFCCDPDNELRVSALKEWCTFTESLFRGALHII